MRRRVQRRERMREKRTRMQLSILWGKVAVLAQDKVAEDNRSSLVIHSMVASTL